MVSRIPREQEEAVFVRYSNIGLIRRAIIVAVSSSSGQDADGPGLIRFPR